MARPSKYKESYCEEILTFFNREPFEVATFDDGSGTLQPIVSGSGKPVLRPCKLPTLEGFAISIGVHRETLLNWAEKHEDFFDALKRAKDMQKEILIQNGLVGAYDKTFAIFTAKNVTDMRDRQPDEVKAEAESLASILSKVIESRPD